MPTSMAVDENSAAAAASGDGQQQDTTTADEATVDAMMMAEAEAAAATAGIDDLNELTTEDVLGTADAASAAVYDMASAAGEEGGEVTTEDAMMAAEAVAAAAEGAEDDDDDALLNPPPDLPPLPSLKPAPAPTAMNEDDAPLASLKKSSGKNSSSKPSRSYYAVRVGYAACPACSASKEEGSEGHQEEGDSKPHICGGSHVSVIRSAIFLRWEDVKDFVEFTTSKLSGERVSTVVAAAAAAAGGKGSSATDGVAGEYNKNEGVIQLPFHHNVEYKQFEELERAERYLKKVIPEFNQAGSNNFGSSSSRSSSKKSKYGKSKAAKAGKTKIKSLSRKAPLPDYPPPKNFNPPTKKWEATYAAAIQYKATYGNLDVPVDEEGPHAELSKWIKYQRTSYRYYLEDPMGGRHSMTDEKVNRLKEVGFDWIVLDKKKWLAEDPVANIGSNGKRKRGRPRKTAAMRLAEMEAAAASAGGGGGGRSSSKNRPIRPKWLAMLQKLKEYKETHGTIEIVAEENMSDELATLSQWCKNQRNMHIRWRQGHDVGMTQEKSDLLKEVGMEFPPAWEDMYVKIVQYKAQNNGSIDIAADYDPILAAWMARQNEVLGRHLQGKSTRLSDDQAMRLLALGFQGGRSAMANGGGGVSVTGKSVASRDFDARWDEMLLRLRDYKAEHGDCNVPTTNGTELAHWVAAQRRMYNKLIAGKPGKRAVLDAVKMQRLTELGFHFRPRGSYAAWEDQMKGLWKFREENGHCRIPVNHPELGSFVKLARRDYKNWTQGKPSSMTPEREAALKDVGFIFEGGKTPQRAQTPIKSWNERLDELLQYKAEFGHTVVPQNSGQLGAWVHSQRVHYKKYKDGQKSQMTAEKALKLTEIGFCFNASDRYRGNKRHRTHEQEEEEAVDLNQHAHHQQQQQHQQHHLHHQLQDAVHVPPFQPYL